MRMAAGNALQDTLPKLLLRNMKERGDRPAIREKALGIWQTWTWSQVHGAVEEMAAGLLAIGIARGDRVALLGDNRPNLYWMMSAIQAIGAVPVPIFHDSPASEIGPMLHGTDTAVAEDQEQVDKLLQVREMHGLPGRIIYVDDRGLQRYRHEGLVSLAAVRAKGREHLDRTPDLITNEIQKGNAADPAVVLMSSGVADAPRAIVLTHDNLLFSAGAFVALDGWTQDDEMLAFMPLAWAVDHVLSFTASYLAGFCLSCPEGAGTVASDLREIGPTIFIATPRLLESLIARMYARMMSAGRMKRALYDGLLRFAQRQGRSSASSVFSTWLWQFGNIVLYGPIRNALGLSRVRAGYVTGDVVSADIMATFRGLGLDLRQCYGITETGFAAAVQRAGERGLSSVGAPLPGVEVKSEGGELLVRGAGLAVGTLDDRGRMQPLADEHGWYPTGDIGSVGPDGRVVVRGRRDSLAKLSDGTAFAPERLEARLKAHHYIKDAVVVASERHAHVAALLSINSDTVGRWAEINGLAYASFSDLSSKSEVADLIAGSLKQINQALATDPDLAKQQIRRFVILNKILDADDGELTRTGKLRRAVVLTRFEDVIDGLFAPAARAADVEGEDASAPHVIHRDVEFAGEPA